MLRNTISKSFAIINFLAISSIVGIGCFLFVEHALRHQVPEISLDYESLKNINALAGFKNNTLIESGGPGEWDETIREIGNIVYHEENRKYYFFYSAHAGEYLQNNVFIGMAYSEDGTDWTKYGRVLESPAEDCYVIILDGIFYMFYEDKSQIPFQEIDMATSIDGQTWTVAKKGVVAPSGTGWQSQDVSSPVVFSSENGFTMLYEGRGGANPGKIGMAKSENLLDWTIRNDPVFHGDSRWAISAVPDDVLKVDGVYIMTYHGGIKDSIWASGLAVSSLQGRWLPVGERPLHTANTLMIGHIGQKYFFAAETSKGVYFFMPAKYVLKNAGSE